MKKQHSGIGTFGRGGSLLTQHSGSIRNFSEKNDSWKPPVRKGGNHGFLSSVWSSVRRLFNRGERVVPGVAGCDEYYELGAVLENVDKVPYRSPSFGDFDEDKSFVKHVLSQLKECTVEGDNGSPRECGDFGIVERQHSGMPRMESNRHLAIRVPAEFDSQKSDFSSVWSGSISEWLPKMKMFNF